MVSEFKIIISSVHRNFSTLSNFNSLSRWSVEISLVLNCLNNIKAIYNLAKDYTVIIKLRSRFKSNYKLWSRCFCFIWTVSRNKIGNCMLKFIVFISNCLSINRFTSLSIVVNNISSVCVIFINHENKGISKRQIRFWVQTW